MALCFVPGVGWTTCAAIADAVVTACGYVATALGGALAGGYIAEELSGEKKGQTKPEVGTCPDCGGETTNKPGKIASDHGLSKGEVKDQIHELKGGRLNNNPHVEVCRDCGEVFPQTKGGGLGDSIGNIRE